MNKLVSTKVPLLVAITSFSLLPFAGAQNLQPIDPLQRPKTGAGSTSFSVSTSYHPNMIRSTMVLGAGLSFTTSYNVTEQFAITASTGTNVFRTERLDDADNVMSNFGATWNGFSVGGQYTFNGGFAPSLGLNIQLPFGKNPWAITGNASASLLRDPVILHGSVAYTYRPTVSTLSMSTGVGFVVNDAVTLHGDAVQSLTFGKLTVPTTTIGLSGAYKISEQHSLKASTTLNMVAGQTSAGVSLGYILRP